MSIENKNLLDGSGKVIEIKESDFTFVQSDKKIHDIKFNTKATTFFKDAMKRFVKSKSALVGGIIVGLLLIFSFIVPLCTPNVGVYNVEKDGGGTLDETLLVPKLFPAGTGFWDGTVKRNDVVYDKENQKPVDYREGTYLNLVTYERVQDNVTSQYGEGGYVNVFCSSQTSNSNFYSKSLSFDPNEDYEFSYNIADITKNNYEFVGYKLSLFDGEKHYYLVGDENSFSKELTDSFNIFNRLEENGYTFGDENLNAKIYFEVSKSNQSGVFGFMPLESVTLAYKTDQLPEDGAEADPNDPVVIFNSLSFKDGNECLLRKTNESGYWTGDFGKIANQVKITYCSFTFDQYYNAYGDRETTLGSRDLTVYELNGSLSLDFVSTGTNATTDEEILAQRFKIIGDDCPIVKVIEQIGDATYNPATNRYSGFSVKVLVSNYKILGYDSMPLYLFGTNSEGKDYLKLMFTGLRSSFFIAIGVSAVNIFIGLVWGSISGYFGGWTDILMERFCDILSGLPQTVLITLCILYGQEFNWGNFADIIALMLALFLTGWMGVAHQTRTQFYRYKGREYVLASRTLGAKDNRLIFRHILPNAAGTIITGSVLIIPSVIYTEASIAYLGLGLQNQVLFGVILSSANQYYRGDNSFLLYIPTFIMMLLLVSFNLFGNGLRDAFNPQLKGSE